MCSGHFHGGEKKEGDIPVPDPEVDPPITVELPPPPPKRTERRSNSDGSSDSSTVKRPKLNNNHKSAIKVILRPTF